MPLPVLLHGLLTTARGALGDLAGLFLRTLWSLLMLLVQIWHGRAVAALATASIARRAARQGARPRPVRGGVVQSGIQLSAELSRAHLNPNFLSKYEKHKLKSLFQKQCFLNLFFDRLFKQKYYFEWPKSIV